MSQEIMDFVDGKVFGIWFLLGAALVFWMQAGFAMVEAGFARAKNAGNILMKNLMDFCIGCVMFILIGFGLFLGEDLVGFIGKPGFDIFTDYANFDWSNFVCNHGNDSKWCDGRENKVLKLLRILGGNFSCHLPDRGTLDMGRRISCTDGIP